TTLNARNGSIGRRPRRAARYSNSSSRRSDASARRCTPGSPKPWPQKKRTNAAGRRRRKALMASKTTTLDRLRRKVAEATENEREIRDRPRLLDHRLAELDEQLAPFPWPVDGLPTEPA